MRILFVMDNAIECNDSNSNIGRLIIEYLRKNNQIYILTHGDRSETQRVFEDNRNLFYHIIEFDYERRKRKYTQFRKIVSKWKKILFLLRHPILLWSCIIYQKSAKEEYVSAYVHSIEKLCKKYGMDGVVAISSPYSTAKAMARAKVMAKKLLYQLDPYSQNYYMRNQPKRVREEHEVLESVDCIITTDLIFEENRNNQLKKYHYKMKSLNYPNVRKINNSYETIDFSQEKINCVFIGNFYKDIRHPKFMIQLFSNHELGDIMLHIVGGTYDGDLSEYMQDIPGKVKFYGRKSSKISFQYLMNADILVSLNNTISNQMPGKIFDYISTGKPIINICKTNKCPTLKILEKYPMVLNIIEEEEAIEKMVQKVFEFCYQYKGKQIEFDEIRMLYNEYTIDVVGQQFEDILKKLVGNI